MCKVMIFTNGSKVKDLKKLVNAIAPAITAKDKDGFGWSAQGSNGVFGERSISSKPQYRLDVNNLAVKLPLIKPVYESIGKVSDISGGLLFHGRTSTNSKGLLNTHPIVRDGFTLIHNGVVDNEGPEYTKLTTNDTEDLVYYLANKGIKGIEANLSGYYAFGAFDPQGRLHIARDSNARLNVAWIKSIQSYVFATTIDLIESVCKKMKWRYGPIEAVTDNIYAIFEGNNLLWNQSIKPLGYGSRQAALMSTSLHYLDSTPETKELDVPESDQFEPQVFDQFVESSEEYLHFDSMDLFIDECDAVDISYQIFDWNGRTLQPWEFKKLDLESKLECTLIRPDGTVLDPYDFDSKKLA